MAQEKKYKIGFRLYAEVELTEEENRLIFYKNAEKLLGITCGNE